MDKFPLREEEVTLGFCINMNDKLSIELRRESFRINYMLEPPEGYVGSIEVPYEDIPLIEMAMARIKKRASGEESYHFIGEDNVKEPCPKSDRNVTGRHDFYIYKGLLICCYCDTVIKQDGTLGSQRKELHKLKGR